MAKKMSIDEALNVMKTGETKFFKTREGNPTYLKKGQSLSTTPSMFQNLYTPKKRAKVIT